MQENAGVIHFGFFLRKLRVEAGFRVGKKFADAVDISPRRLIDIEKHMADASQIPDTTYQALARVLAEKGKKLDDWRKVKVQVPKFKDQRPAKPKRVAIPPDLAAALLKMHAAQSLEAAVIEALRKAVRTPAPQPGHTPGVAEPTVVDDAGRELRVRVDLRDPPDTDQGGNQPKPEPRGPHGRRPVPKK